MMQQQPLVTQECWQGLLHCDSFHLFLFVTDAQPSASIRLRDLQLATAHALVAQSLGSEQTLREQVPLQYLQNLIDWLVRTLAQGSLTALPNRRHGCRSGAREIDRVARSGRRPAADAGHRPFSGA